MSLLLSGELLNSARILYGVLEPFRNERMSDVSPQYVLLGEVVLISAKF